MAGPEIEPVKSFTLKQSQLGVQINTSKGTMPTLGRLGKNINHVVAQCWELCAKGSSSSSSSSSSSRSRS